MPTSTRAAALAMVHKLHWERLRAGQRRIQWVSSDVIVERPEDVEELTYAVEHGRIAVAPERDAHRRGQPARRRGPFLTAETRRWHGRPSADIRLQRTLIRLAKIRSRAAASPSQTSEGKEMR